MTHAALPWLEVKNWKEHQHYGGERDMLWIKVYFRVLNDYTFTLLPEVTRYQLMAIWLVASKSGGFVPNDAEWLGRQISAASPVDLDTLIDAGFLLPTNLPASRYQVASNPLGTVEERRIEERREEEKEAAAARLRVIVEETAQRFPEEYRDDFHAHLRASHRPEALVREVKKILDGDESACKGATAPDVGSALRDVAMLGKPLSGSILRGFVRGAMQRRETPSSGIRLPKAEDEYDAAIRKAQSRA